MDLVAHGVLGAAGEFGVELVAETGDSDGVGKVAYQKRDHFAGGGATTVTLSTLPIHKSM